MHATKRELKKQANILPTAPHPMSGYKIMVFVEVSRDI